MTVTGNEYFEFTSIYLIKDGKNCAGAEVVDDCVWIGGKVQKLIPIKALCELNIETTHEFDTDGYNRYLKQLRFSTSTFSRTTTTYTLNYMEIS